MLSSPPLYWKHSSRMPTNSFYLAKANGHLTQPLESILVRLCQLCLSVFLPKPHGSWNLTLKGSTFQKRAKFQYPFTFPRGFLDKRAGCAGREHSHMPAPRMLTMSFPIPEDRELILTKTQLSGDESPSERARLRMTLMAPSERKGLSHSLRGLWEVHEEWDDLLAKTNSMLAGVRKELQFQRERVTPFHWVPKSKSPGRGDKIREELEEEIKTSPCTMCLPLNP